MSENTDLRDEGTWRLLAEFALPIDPDTPDQVVAHVVSAVAALHLPEARLRQVREIVIDALANHADQPAILVRLFIARSDRRTRDHALPVHGWGLFSIQKVLEPEDTFDGLLFVLEVYFYT